MNLQDNLTFDQNYEEILSPEQCEDLFLIEKQIRISKEKLELEEEYSDHFESDCSREEDEDEPEIPNEEPQIKRKSTIFKKETNYNYNEIENEQKDKQVNSQEEENINSANDSPSQIRMSRSQEIQISHLQDFFIFKENVKVISSDNKKNREQQIEKEVKEDKEDKEDREDKEDKQDKEVKNDKIRRMTYIIDEDQQKQNNISLYDSQFSKCAMKESITYEEDLKLQRQDNYIFNKLRRKEQMILDFKMQYQPIQEGYLNKKSSFYGWNKRFFVLTNSKLFYFDSEKKQKVRGVINFNIARCHITLNNDKSFTINIEDFNSNYHLKGVKNDSVQQWINQINYIIANTKSIQKPKIKANNLNLYTKDDTIMEEDFLNIAETGDILLFSTDNFAAKMQRGLTRSKFDHVGLIVKFENQQVRVFESSGDTGVGLTIWNQFIRVNDLYRKVVIRKLTYSKKNELETVLLTFIAQTLGKKYLLTAGKLFKRTSLKETKDEDQGYFCSELVAKAYKLAGLLDPVKSSCQYWPVTFSQEKNLKLKRGASLSTEIVILLKKHRNQ